MTDAIMQPKQLRSQFVLRTTMSVEEMLFLIKRIQTPVLHLMPWYGMEDDSF